MEAYKERVVAEKRELDERLERLVGFMASDKFQELPQDERIRMHRQAYLMREYSAVLGERMLAWPV